MAPTGRSASSTGRRTSTATALSRFRRAPEHALGSVALGGLSHAALGLRISLVRPLRTATDQADLLLSPPCLPVSRSQRLKGRSWAPEDAEWGLPAGGTPGLSSSAATAVLVLVT